MERLNESGELRQLLKPYKVSKFFAFLSTRAFRALPIAVWSKEMHSRTGGELMCQRMAFHIQFKRKQTVMGDKHIWQLFMHVYIEINFFF